MMVTIGLGTPVVTAGLGTLEGQHRTPLIPALLVLFGCYGCAYLIVINRAIRQLRDVSTSSWWITTAVETLFPSATLIILSESAVPGPYAVLVAPPALLYLLFILLSFLCMR